jgi:hypothetical protein
MATQTKKATGSLKNLVDAGKTPSVVLGAVERWQLAQPADTSRRTDVLHPSEIIKPDWCPRASWHLLQGAKPAPKKLTTKQMRVFKRGHQLHDDWQANLAAMGKLWGDWKCAICTTVVARESLRPKFCPHCEGEDFIYDEVRVASDAHRIEGHADGIIVGIGKEPLLLEIKSIGEGTIRWEDPSAWIASGNDFKKAWAALNAPFYSHIMQAQMYMKLLELMYEGTMFSYPKKAVFIYETKGDQEVKEFVVPKSDFGITDIFDKALEIAKAIKAGIELPCVDQSGSCSKCEVFNGN